MIRALLKKETVKQNVNVHELKKPIKIFKIFVKPSKIFILFIILILR